jgi:hypothetical protein
MVKAEQQEALAELQVEVKIEQLAVKRAEIGKKILPF